MLKDFTFSSGLHVPAGVTLAVPTHTTYRDSRLYPDPDTFDPLRFYKKRAENNDAENRGTSFVDTSISDYVFSYGVHIWCVMYPQTIFYSHRTNPRTVPDVGSRAQE